MFFEKNVFTGHKNPSECFASQCLLIWFLFGGKITIFIQITQKSKTQEPKITKKSQIKAYALNKCNENILIVRKKS
jgi:hypothetical protein